MKKLIIILTAAAITTALFSCAMNEGNKSPDTTQIKNTTVNTAANNEETTPAPGTGSANTTDTTQREIISRDSAIDAALSHAGLSRDSVFGIEAELDRERTELIWEVEFDSGEYEYSYDINAYTGDIVKSERDRD